MNLKGRKKHTEGKVRETEKIPNSKRTNKKDKTQKFFCFDKSTKKRKRF